MARRPYTTYAVLIQGQPPVKIKWYPVPRENGTLPFPTRINSLDWHTAPHLHEGVGEVYGADRNFNRAKERSVIGDHICGTEDDFRNGQKFPDGRLNLEYLPSGLPKCCDPFVREARVSIGVGGSSFDGGVIPEPVRLQIGVAPAAVVFNNAPLLVQAQVGVAPLAQLVVEPLALVQAQVGVAPAAQLVVEPLALVQAQVGVAPAAQLLDDGPQLRQAQVGVGGETTLTVDAPRVRHCGIGLGPPIPQHVLIEL